jgi:protein-S-isoprenylcysteine O-methyltransferase
VQFPLTALLGLAFALSEAALGFFKRSRDDSVDADRRSLRVLWISNTVAVFGGIVASYRLPEAAIGAARPLFWIGTMLFALGLALRWYSIYYLGRYFTVNVAIHSRHEIIDTGPYKLIRHPSYLGALLAFLGLASCLANWVSLAIIVIPTMLAFRRRMNVEEHALASALGTPYTNYMRRTKRLVPNFY